MQRILSGLGMAGLSSTSSNERSALAPLAAAASAGSALAAMASRRLGQRDEVRPDRSTIPPSTTAPILAASAWRKLTKRMGGTMSVAGKIGKVPSYARDDRVLCGQDPLSSRAQRGTFMTPTAS